jgi:hypothetical protein
MISLVARGVLLSLGLVLATALVARPASAQSFWGGPNCSDPNTVSSHFTGSFAGADKCQTVCKVAAGACRALVKDAVSCSKDEGASYYQGFGVMCSTLTGMEKQSCVDALKSDKANFKESIAASKASALANCGAFLDSCILGCTAPL